MCGICFLLKVKLSNADIEILKKMKDYYESFEDDKSKFQECSKEEINIIENFSINGLLEGNFYELINVIKNRGPDYLSVNEFSYTDWNMKELSKVNLDNMPKYSDVFNYLSNNNSILVSSVLSLRGNTLTKQPIINDSTHNILQYNGEIFSINDSDENLIIDNDGLILSKMLSNFSNSITSDNNKEYVDKFFRVMNKIESDHALIFHDIKNKKIVVNRDIFGKRSLILVYIHSLNILILSSVLSKSLYSSRNSKDITIIEVPNNSALVISPFNNENKFYFSFNYTQLSSLRFNNLYPEIESNFVDLCTNYLSNAVKKRIITSNSKTIGILFSGGIDSLLISYFALANSTNDIVIDLFNLSFSGSDAPDRNSGIISYIELIKKFPSRDVNLVIIDAKYSEIANDSTKSEMMSLIYPRESHMDFNISTALKRASKKIGKKIIKESLMESEVTTCPLSNIDKSNYNNNILSKQINKISYEKFLEDEEYISPAKIILSGLGADEFFGGYSRYKNGDIIQHMSKDINRIWMRNFGRDDRACSDNGIELRFPFFDSDLITFLSRIRDIKECTNFSMQRGFGEKLLLRKVAKQIGFEFGAMFEKRAIQFGTRLAHETNVNTYGSNRKANGKAQFK